MEKKRFSYKVKAVLLLLLCPGFFSIPKYQNDEKTAFVNVNLLPMTDKKIIMDQSVIIENGKIVEIGDSHTTTIPEDAKIIEGKGGYLMPGLADMHMHFHDEVPVSILSLYLANGVTTIRSLAGSPYQLKLRKKIKNGELAGPTIYISGPIISTSSLGVKGAREVRAEVIRQKRAGYDFIKLYSFLSKEEFYAAVKTAKELNMYTVGHIPYSVGFDGVIEAGLDEIAHIEEFIWEFLEGLNREHPNPFGLKINYGKLPNIMTKLRKSKIKLCTTLAIDEVIVEKIISPKRYINRPEAVYLSKSAYDAISSGKDHHQMIFAKGKEMLEWIKLYKKILVEAKKLDIPLVIGTDAGAYGEIPYGVIHGFSLHDELHILIKNGFSPYQAIAFATRRAAEAINKKNEWGTIEIGKRADLILTEKNPLIDINNIKKKHGVMASGRWYSEGQLQKMIYIKDWR